ncbi:MAG: methyl-accepting chemotaxis protein [Peptococcaceae bacterium]|nr:methyl-accepting chemotaxis protein [Peptococcaceae bacterium]
MGAVLWKFLGGKKKEHRVGEEAITVIKDAPEQTHLLGLNAAIEADRAGERGRGFNVVTAEIRTPAAKVRESVKTIGQSFSCIATGVTLSAPRVTNLNEVAQVQAKSTQEIGSSVVQLGLSTATLEKISKEAWI